MQNYWLTLAFFLAAVGLWAYPAILLHEVSLSLMSKPDYMDVTFFAIICVPFAVVGISQIFRAYRYFRYEGRYLESCMRILFTLIPLGAILVRGTSWLPD